jgi:CheY-like chemotaxis protein
MKILVADQEVNHRGSLIDLISSLGHTAVETIDSREVIKECRHKCPDLIFLDYMLSGVLAVDLINQIRRLGGNFKSRTSRISGCRSR